MDAKSNSSAYLVYIRILPGPVRNTGKYEADNYSQESECV